MTFLVKELSEKEPCEIVYTTSVIAENWMRKPELFLKMNRLTHSGEIVRGRGSFDEIRFVSG